MGRSVAIFGAGVAGMTAAHELVDRGFHVCLYEQRSILGGKARSIKVERQPPFGEQPLPGEHGFRFFGGFYRHVLDTMRRIPSPVQGHSVADKLVETTRAEFARAGRASIVLPVRFPRNLADLAATRGFVSVLSLGISASDWAYFAERLWVLLASCEERRYSEWEHTSWWAFSGAEKRPLPYQQFLADGMTRRFVAAQAREISARTCGYILLQLMLDNAPGHKMDRVLNGPTNDVWIDPWAAYLRRRGVEFHLDHVVTAINCDAGRVSSVVVRSGIHHIEVVADYFVAAVPVEIMSALATPALCTIDPRFAGLTGLRTRWMNGIQFYFDRDIPMTRGHTIYMDAPFGLSSISQRQFWDVDLASMGIGGILSVDISDWATPGLLFRKPAMELTPEQIQEEVWAQLNQHLDAVGQNPLKDAKLLGWFMDPDIVLPNPREMINLEPLLINTVGSWDIRPTAVTHVENLFLASDYVRTYTDLATMEAANEAARRAVNGILDAVESSAERCGVWQLHEPVAFAPLRALDRVRFKSGMPVELPTRQT
jgi:uncharacterized protein with NAD-binding domain and iron-sulfur cluster